MTATIATTGRPPRAELLYTGKAKGIYATVDPDLLIVHYSDNATAFNGAKHGTIADKGQINNQVSATLMRLVAQAGIPTHLVDVVSEREQLVRRVNIVPLEVVVRNIAAGSLAKRLGIREGTRLDRPIVEYYYKRDDLGDPLVTRAHVSMLGIAEPETLDRMASMALKVNDVLRAFLGPRGVTLVDFKLEFGFDSTGTLLLADEISPDTCRFWGDDGRHLDKDVFRRDLGDPVAAYAELWERIR